MLGTEKSKR